MTHTIQAIAWTLIHFCWQAAAVAVLYRLISMAFARKTSQTRYVLAVSALLLMLACACATFAWELRSGAAASSALATSGSADQSAIPTGEFPRTMMPGFAAAQTQVYSPSLANMLLWIDGFWIMGVVVAFPAKHRWLVAHHAPAYLREYSGTGRCASQFPTAFCCDGLTPPRIAARLKRDLGPDDRRRPSCSGAAADYRRNISQP